MPKPASFKPIRVVGFCWFHRDGYQDARAAMSDPDVLFDTFDEWLKAAKKIEDEVSAKGDKVVRIRFDLASFLLFCVGAGRLPDEQARAAWASAEVKKKFLGQG